MSNKQMRPTRRCYDLIRKYEGCRLQAYQDPAGIWTIGYGHTGNVRPGQVITKAEAERLLQEDVERIAHSVRDILGDSPTTPGQFDALVSLSYNIGPGALAKSTLMKYHKNGDYNLAVEEFKRWIYSKKGGVKVILAGLVARRLEERWCYIGSHYYEKKI